jgi:hypothetical protein
MFRQKPNRKSQILQLHIGEQRNDAKDLRCHCFCHSRRSVACRQGFDTACANHQLATDRLHGGPNNPWKVQGSQFTRRQRSYVSETTAENLWGKKISHLGFMLYLYDRNKDRNRVKRILLTEREPASN